MLHRALIVFFLAASFASAQTAPDELRYSPDRERMAIEYRTRAWTLHFLETGWEIAALALAVRWRAGRKLRDRRLGALAISGAVLAGLSMIDLPGSVYGHSLGLRFGLSIEPWGPWLWDWTKETAISLVIGIPLVAGALALARRLGRRWWIWAWAGAVVVMCALTLAAPLVFDPLFHTFRPLSQRHTELVPKLEAVVARAGLRIPPERMFEMEASEKSRAVNAYLTGFGASKRIVLWDTTIAALTPEQIQSVFAHESGHYALHHVPWSLAIGAVALAALFWALARFLGQEAGDAAALPKAILFLSVIGFLSEPAAATYSRWIERQADIFELEVMHGLVPDAGRVSAQVDLIMADIDLEHPRPNAFIRIWLYDHPPSAERMRFALRYDPWGRGEQPKYVR